MMTKTKLRTLALTLALMTGASGVVHAAPADAPAPQASQPAPEHGRHGPRDFRGHGMKHHGGPVSPFMMLGKLKGKLNLTADQQTRWNAAQAQTREVGKAMREQRQADRKALQQQLASGPADFRALVTRQEASRAAFKPRMDAARDAWLVAYDSLDTKQKQIVTDAFKKQLARGEHRGPRGEHRGPRGNGPARDGQPVAPRN